MSNTDTHEKAFGPLLESCAELLQIAYETRAPSLSQSAVLQSSLLLEAAANCCILSLGLPRALLDELDRLPTLTKYETFLLIKKRGIVTLDRSCLHYQSAVELKRLRDIAVHPKTTRITWTPDGDGISGTPAKTRILGLSRDPASWSYGDAIAAFRAANAFLDNFFRKDCKLPAKVIRLLLFTAEDDDTTDIWLANSSLTWAARTQQVTLTYAGVR